METITTGRYQRIIELFIAPLQLGEYYCWLQQDEAMAHIAGLTMQILNKFFRDPTTLWTPCNFDLTPADFYLWDYVNRGAFQNPTTSIPGSK